MRVIYFTLLIFIFVGCNIQKLAEKPKAPPVPRGAGGGKYYDDIGIDPLYKYMWHVNNVGQNNFSSQSGLPGNDINLSTVHNMYRGEGQTIIISDGRIDLDHVDLVQNTDLGLSKNYAVSMGLGFSPTSANDSHIHGTFVMGLAGAKRGNGIGTFGIAPNAKLVGYNFIDSTQSLSISLDNATVKKSNQITDGIGTFNYSFGSFTCSVVSFSYLEEYFLKEMTHFGNIYVTSGGNDKSGSTDNCSVSGFTYYGNGNLNQIKSLPYYIVTGALNSRGVSADYSTPSSNTWIVAPGGETTTGYLISTDLEGCSKGTALSSAIPFDLNGTGENVNCNFSIDYGSGTSYASPIVTGAIALFRQICPSCKWREIKYAMAKNARKVDASIGDKTHPFGPSADLAGHTYLRGWNTNAAGFNFHNYYGFGGLDVAKTVSYLKENTINLFDARWTYTDQNQGFYYNSGTVNLAIPDNSATGVTSTISVDKHNLKIEHVQIKVNITHPVSSNIGIELKSPSGTVSQLMLINSGIISGNLTNTYLGTNAFYGERTLGDWEIKVIDGASSNTGTLVNWSLAFMGNKGQLEDRTSPSPVTTMGVAGNTISWVHSASTDVMRYDVCIKKETDVCLDYEWIPIGYVNNYTVARYFDGIWQALVSSERYTFRIRAVDSSENASTINWGTWIAP